MEPIIIEYQDVFLEDLPREVPPMRDIHHTNNPVPSTTLPNLLHYRMNPPEQAELKKKVDELLEKGFIRIAYKPLHRTYTPHTK